MILMIDNYDSFTYNIVQYFGAMGVELLVRRNDELTLDEMAELEPTGIVLSPGPCTPDQAGVCVPAVQRFGGQLPILGVCLGHQAIGQAFGGKVVRAGKLMHGKPSDIVHGGVGVFEGLPSPFSAIRYHSLVIERATLPDCLEVTATSAEDDEIMGIRHKHMDMEGIQFHPESVLTEHGKTLLMNFAKRAGVAV